MYQFPASRYINIKYINLSVEIIPCYLQLKAATWKALNVVSAYDLTTQFSMSLCKASIEWHLGMILEVFNHCLGGVLLLDVCARHGDWYNKSHIWTQSVLYGHLIAVSFDQSFYLVIFIKPVVF